jgi:hypothetical protein
MCWHKEILLHLAIDCLTIINSAITHAPLLVVRAQLLCVTNLPDVRSESIEKVDTLLRAKAGEKN